MPSALACQHGLRANVIRASVIYVWRCLRASVLKACQLLNSKCQRANKHAIRRASFSTWRIKVPNGVPKDVPIFRTLLLRNAKGNFYTLLLYKKFYIRLWYHSYTNHMYIIVRKSCIILHFCASMSYWWKVCGFFLFFFFPFLLLS